MYRNNHRHRNMYQISHWSWSFVDHIPTSQHSHCFSLYLCSTFEQEHASLRRKILLTVLWSSSSLQLSLHWHNVCLLIPISWGRRDDSRKVLNLVSTWDIIISSLCWTMIDHTQASGPGRPSPYSCGQFYRKKSNWRFKKNLLHSIVFRNFHCINFCVKVCKNKWHIKLVFLFTIVSASIVGC